MYDTITSSKSNKLRNLALMPILTTPLIQLFTPAPRPPGLEGLNGLSFNPSSSVHSGSPWLTFLPTLPKKPSPYPPLGRFVAPLTCADFACADAQLTSCVLPFRAYDFGVEAREMGWRGEESVGVAQPCAAGFGDGEREKPRDDMLGVMGLWESIRFASLNCCWWPSGLSAL